jgi:hypothetical protein
LTEASRRLATQGVAAARDFLLIGEQHQVGDSSAGIDKAALFESYDEWQRSQQR